MQKMLRVSDIGDMQQDKRGRNYRVVRFTTNNLLDDGTPIFSNQSTGTRTIWDEFEGFKADGLWSLIKDGQVIKGSLVEGSIVRFQTTPYTIGDNPTKELTSYTCTIFGHEDPIEYANKQLAPNRACVVVGGVLTNREQTEGPVIALASNLATRQVEQVMPSSL